MARNLMVGPIHFLFSFWNGAEEESAFASFKKKKKRERDGGALVMDLLSIIITISRGP